MKFQALKTFEICKGPSNMFTIEYITHLRNISTEVRLMMHKCQIKS